jgi:hypothetical protein
LSRLLHDISEKKEGDMIMDSHQQQIMQKGHDFIQQNMMNGPDNYQRSKELATLAVGGGGISLSFFDVASYAQAAGMIIGFFIVCYQAYKIIKTEWRNFKNRRKKNADKCE